MNKEIQFFTKDAEFVIEQGRVLKNGEVVGEGNVYLFQLLLGYPAYIIVTSDNHFIPPVVIKTDTVRSILPENEHFDGEKPQKKRYVVHFNRDGMDMLISIEAVEPFHAEQLIKTYYGDIDIFNVSPMKERVLC